MVSKCFIFPLIVQQSLNYVLTYLFPHSPYHHYHPVFELGKQFVCPAWRITAMMQHTWIPEVPPSIYGLPQPAWGEMRSRVPQAQACLPRAGPEMPRQVFFSGAERIPMQLPAAMREGFPETCPWRCFDKENRTCSLASCNHGWAGWRRIGVSQCLDNYDLGAILKYFNCKPLYSVRWPTWSYPGLIGKFAHFFCSSCSWSQNCNALVRMGSLAWKASVRCQKGLAFLLLSMRP